MWVACSAGKAFRLAALCVLLGFVAGLLVGVRLDTQPLAAPHPPAPSSAALPASSRTSGEEVTTWSRTVSRSRC